MQTYLFLVGECRSTDLTGIDGHRHVLYMIKYDVGWPPIVLRILPAPNIRNMRGDASIDYNILPTSMLGHWQTSQYFETPTIVNLVGDFSQRGVQRRERERFLVDEAKWFIKGW